MYINKIKLKLALFLGILNLSSANLWAKKDEKNQVNSGETRNTNIVEEYKKELKLRMKNTENLILTAHKRLVKIQRKINKEMEKVVEIETLRNDINVLPLTKILKTYVNTFCAEQRIEILEKELEHQIVHINSFTSNIPRCEELLLRTPSSDEEEKAFKEDIEQLKMDQSSQFEVKRNRNNKLLQEKNYIDHFEKKALSIYYAWDTNNHNRP